MGTFVESFRRRVILRSARGEDMDQKRWPLLVACLFVVTSAIAASPQRTFVSVSGNDSNPCSLTLPCRGFSAAVAVAASDGEVIVLDSGGYGTVAITKPISIIAPSGIYAGVSVLSGSGVVVDVPSGTVRLTGLTITGLGGTLGIEFRRATALRLERISASGFTADYSAGLDAHVSDTAIMIRDSTFTRNYWPIVISSYPGITRVDIEHSDFSQNATGAWFDANINGVVSSSVFSDNSASGAYVQSSIPVGNPPSASAMTFRNCVFSGNVGSGLVTGTPILDVLNKVTVHIDGSEFSDNGSAGINVQIGSYTTLSESTVTRNQFGTNSIWSFTDNRLFNNVTGDGSVVPIAKK